MDTKVENEAMEASQATEASQARRAAIQRAVTTAAVVSILGNALLTVGKYWLGTAYGSFALRADGLHSAIDVIASLVVLGGVAIAARHSVRFPYGLYKAENLVSLFVALTIFAAGAEIAREAFSAGGPGPTNIPITAAGAAASALVSYGLARYKSWVGRRTGSPSMVSEGYHSLTDVYSSAVVLASILGSALGLRLDHVAAFVVVVFILYSGWQVLVESVRVLLDAGLDRAAYGRIKGVIEAVPGVTAVNFLTGRNAGRLKFVEAAVALHTGSLVRAHEMTERIEAEVRRKVPGVERVVVHAEPQALAAPGTRVAVPVIDERGRLSDGLGSAPWFVLADMGDGGPAQVRTVPNPFREAEQRRGLSIARWLVGQGVTVLASREDVTDKAPGLALSNAGVRLVVTAAETADEVWRELAERAQTRG